MAFVAYSDATEILRSILPLLSYRGSWKKRDKACKEEKMSLGLRVKGGSRG